jgi:hypothetical protein
VKIDLVYHCSLVDVPHSLSLHDRQNVKFITLNSLPELPLHKLDKMRYSNLFIKFQCIEIPK